MKLICMAHPLLTHTHSHWTPTTHTSVSGSEGQPTRAAHPSLRLTLPTPPRRSAIIFLFYFLFFTLSNDEAPEASRHGTRRYTSESLCAVLHFWISGLAPRALAVYRAKKKKKGKRNGKKEGETGKADPGMPKTQRSRKGRKEKKKKLSLSSHGEREGENWMAGRNLSIIAEA